MSGKKFDQNKAPISLIPREAIEEEAKALAFGAAKYGRFNFREGIAYSRLIDAALRHILALADGEDIDPESGCNHAANARANLGMLIFMMSKKQDMDDRWSTAKINRGFMNKEDIVESKNFPGVSFLPNDIVMAGSKK